MTYYCARCEKEVEVNFEELWIRCPYCWSRILKKKRPKVMKTVKAE